MTHGGSALSRRTWEAGQLVHGFVGNIRPPRPATPMRAPLENGCAVNLNSHLVLWAASQGLTSRVEVTQLAVDRAQTY
jgi:hypothetical protein